MRVTTLWRIYEEDCFSVRFRCRRRHVATPASAAVKTGGRIEAVTGYDNVSIDAGGGVNVDASGVTFGLGAGYDFAAGKKVAIGIDVEGTMATTDLDPTPTEASRPSATSMPAAG